MDDTNLELGLPDLGPHLPPGTYTWCAVVVPSIRMEHFIYRSASFTSKYGDRWEVDAVHFTDLVNGNRAFREKDVSPVEKTECVREAVDTLLESDARIIQHSGYDKRVKELAAQGAFEWFPQGLRKTDAKDAALAFELEFVNGYLAHKGAQDAVVVVEEHGGRVPGKYLSSSRYTSFAQQRVEFGSKQVSHLQFADLAAYGYARGLRNYASADFGDVQHALWRELVRLDPLRWSPDMERNSVNVEAVGPRHRLVGTRGQRTIMGKSFNADDPEYYS